AGVDWLRQPRLDVHLPARPCRLHDVDRQSRRGGDKKCRGVTNDASIGRLPAHPDVLDDVLGFRGASNHSIGDAKETRTHTYDGRQAVIAGVALVRTRVGGDADAIDSLHGLSETVGLPDNGIPDLSAARPVRACGWVVD